MLRSRRRREESRLPDPVVVLDSDLDPEQEAVEWDGEVGGDSVGLALLVVLDRLSPAERLAFVLHDMFELPFDEIADSAGLARSARWWAARRPPLGSWPAGLGAG